VLAKYLPGWKVVGAEDPERTRRLEDATGAKPDLATPSLADMKAKYKIEVGDDDHRETQLGGAAGEQTVVCNVESATGQRMTVGISGGRIKWTS
jgi:hypothetical protein